MPHDSLDDVAGTAVVQAVFSPRAEFRQTASPQRSGAAPAGTYVVLHAEFVLYEVGVGPNLLVREAGHIAVLEETRGVLQFVLARGPRRTVALGATDLREEFLALLDFGIVQVTRSRYCQTAVPNHQLLELLVGHLDRQVLRHQVIIDIFLHVARVVLAVCLLALRQPGNPCGELVLHVRILRSLLGVIGCHVVETAVGTGYVGDVPDSVCTCSVHQRSARHRVGEAAYIRCTVAALCGVRVVST